MKKCAICSVDRSDLNEEHYLYSTIQNTFDTLNELYEYFYTNHYKPKKIDLSNYCSKEYQPLEYFQKNYAGNYAKRLYNEQVKELEGYEERKLGEFVERFRIIEILVSEQFNKDTLIEMSKRHF